MGKHDSLKYLERTRARVDHLCSHCGRTIHAGEEYYKETLKDGFLHSLHAECFCADCHKLFGDELLEPKAKKRITEDNKSRKLSNFI